MYITRIAKVVMVACLAVFCLLVAFGNVTDYQANFLFVKHVMSMDTTYPGNTLMYRAITSPELWHAAFVLIIIGEALAGVLFLAGAIRLFQARRDPGAVFDSAKGWTVAGALVAFLVWFFGFMVVAGEWFLMWQSETWNGQPAAFRFYLTALAVLIFVIQPDRDLPEKVTRLSAKPARAPAKKKAPAKKSAAKKSAAKKSVAKKRVPAKKKTAAKTSGALSRIAAVRTELEG
jgi:predicted small integral membrane protein